MIESEGKEVEGSLLIRENVTAALGEDITDDSFIEAISIELNRKGAITNRVRP